MARHERMSRDTLLTGGTGGVHAAVASEAGRLGGLVARNRRPTERPVGPFLEDRAQSSQRRRALPPDPAGGADLEQPVDDRGGLAERGELHAGHATRLLAEVVDGERAVAPATPEADLLDDAPRPIDLTDGELGVLLGERRMQAEARSRPLTHGVHAREPVVVQVVVGVGGPRGEVVHEVEDLLARCGYDRGDADLAHGRAPSYRLAGGAQAALGTTDSLRSLACRRSPASGARRQSAQRRADEGSARTQRRISREARSGIGEAFAR